MSPLVAKIRRPQVTIFVLSIATMSFVLSIVLPISSIPSYFMPLPITQDKFLHTLMFAVLTLVSRVCCPWSFRRLIIVLVAMAALSECAQALLPHRSCNLADFQANIIGIAIGCGIIVLCKLIGDQISRYHARDYR